MSAYERYAHTRQHVLTHLDASWLPFIMDTPAKILSMALECWIPVPLSHNAQIFNTKRAQIITPDSAGSSTKKRPSFLSQDQGQSLETVEKAVKADDAEANYMLWDNRIWALQLHSEQSYLGFKAFLESTGRPKSASHLEILQVAMLCYWRKRVSCCLHHYLRAKYGSHPMRKAPGSAP